MSISIKFTAAGAVAALALFLAGPLLAAPPENRLTFAAGSSRPFKGDIGKQAALGAAFSASRIGAMQAASRKLADFEEIRFFLGNNSLSPTRNADPLAVAYALCRLEGNNSFISGVPPDMRVDMELSYVLDENADIKHRLAELMAAPELLWFLGLAAHQEQSALAAYDASADQVLNLMGERRRDRALTRQAASRMSECYAALCAIQDYMAILPRMYAPNADWPQLCSELKKLVLADPGNYLIGNALGSAYLKLDMATDAKAALDEVINLNPGFSAAFNTRGIAMLRLELPALAVSDFSQAIKLDPDNPVFYYHRAMALLVQEKMDLMCMDLQHSCRLGACDAYAWAVDAEQCPRELPDHLQPAPAPREENEPKTQPPPARSNFGRTRQ